jgi:Uma2 family endonuclease
MTTKIRATIEDLYDAPGKAEIINGELVLMSPTGEAPNYAAGEIFVSLRQHSRRTRIGRAVTDNAGFKVKLPNRDSLSPDAAYYIGPSRGMKFFEQAPVFAVEVRSESDYGSKAEARIAEKRRDYFTAGTLCVWDVDLLNQDVIKSYQANDPEAPIIFRRGEIANAGEAVPGWTMPVDDLFPEEE